LPARDREVDSAQNLDPVRRSFDGPGQTDYFNDWARNARLLYLIRARNASVMIMAVSLTPTSAPKSAWMLAAAVLVTLGGCGSHSARQETTVSTPPEPISPVAKTEAAPDNRPKIVAFGDSLSAGFGLAAGQSYPDDLQRLLDAAHYPYQIVNEGVSGDTTTDGVQRLSDVIALHPAVVILEFGANDGLRGVPVTEAYKNLTTMVEALQKSRARILLAGMTLPRNYGPEYIHAFEQMYPDLARKYHLARMPFLLQDVGGHSDLTQSDGLHPTAEGARIVAHNLMPYLIPLLRQ
jgi:acyl-CoA thioesterase-1